MTKIEQKLNTWRKVKLGEVALEARDLYQPSKEEHLPYIGLEHIQPQMLRFTEIGDSRQVQSTKKRFKAGDVLFGSLRAYFRKVIRPDFDGVCSTDITVLRPRNDELNRKYLFYLVADKRFIDRAAGSGEGTRMPRAGWKVISKFDFNIPSEITDQKRIADILSAFDDKIELNNKISRTLEQMAQTIFKEWFVNFKFPGHEKEKLVDSELGKIPEGWEFSNVGDVAKNHDSKRVPLSAMERSKRKGHIPYYGANGILDYIDEAIFSGEYVLIAEDGTVKTDKNTPVIFLVNEDFWVNNHAHIISGNKVSTYFLYLSLRNIHVDSYITGGVQPKITQQNLNSIPVVLPSDEVQKEFEDIAQPIKEKLQLVNKENQKLSALRDLLLPKLMSGEMPV